MALEKLSWVLQTERDTPAFKADFSGGYAHLTQYDETASCANKWCWQLHLYPGPSCTAIAETFEEGEAMIFKAHAILTEAKEKIFGTP